MHLNFHKISIKFIVFGFLLLIFTTIGMVSSIPINEEKFSFEISYINNEKIPYTLLYSFENKLDFILDYEIEIIHKNSGDGLYFDSFRCSPNSICEEKITFNKLYFGDSILIVYVYDEEETIIKELFFTIEEPKTDTQINLQKTYHYHDGYPVLIEGDIKRSDFEKQYKVEIYPEGLEENIEEFFLECEDISCPFQFTLKDNIVFGNYKFRVYSSLKNYEEDFSILQSNLESLVQKNTNDDNKNSNNFLVSSNVKTEVENSDNFLLENSNNDVIIKNNISINKNNFQIIAGEPVVWRKNVSFTNLKNGINLSFNPQNITIFNNSDLLDLTYSFQNLSNGTVSFKIENLEFFQNDSNSENNDRFKSIKDDFIGIASSLNEILNEDIVNLTSPTTSSNLILSYTTSAPKIIEKNISSEKKQVTISSSYHYTNILAFSYLPDVPLETINLYHIINDTRIKTAFIPYDMNGNDNIDYIEWVVPHLSNQTYEIELDILNIFSNPSLNGNWTVEFNTYGTANLTIYPSIDLNYYDGETTWDDNFNLSADMEFIGLFCGENEVSYEWINNSVFVENYYCDETSYEISRIITEKKHVLKFNFGNQIELAYNDIIWNDANFKYRSKITIDSDKIDADLYNWTMIISQDISNFQYEGGPLDLDGTRSLKSDGGDIRITDNSNTRLPIDLRHISLSNDPSNSVLELAVKVPFVSSSEDTVLWFFWGNSSAIQPPVSDTYGQYNAYDEYHLGVWPDGAQVDRTGNGNNLLCVGNINSGSSSGIIGNSTYYDGSGDYCYDNSLSSSVNSDVTINFFFRHNGHTISSMRFLDLAQNVNEGLNVRNFNTLPWDNYIGLDNNFGPTTNVIHPFDMSGDIWHSFSAKRDSNVYSIYVDGTFSTSVVGVIPTYTRLWFGNRAKDSWKDYKGYLDEISVSKTSRNESWLSSTYENVMNMSNFASIETVIPFQSNLCDNLEGGEWVLVPGNGDLGVSDFCVMKYEAKCVEEALGSSCSVVTDTVISQPENSPWTNINHSQAKNMCEGLGDGYHLITHYQWTTIARNVVNQTVNWADGVYGSSVDTGGGLFRGNTGQTTSVDYDGADPEGGIGRDTKARLTLSNGEEIWDFSGNVWEWNNDSRADHTWDDGAVDLYWNSTLDNDLRYNAGPLDSSLGILQGIGRISGYDMLSNSTEGMFVKGGYYSGGFNHSGIYSIYFGLNEDLFFSTLGFRCAYSDLTSPIIELISPSSSNIYSVSDNVSFIWNVTDSSSSNFTCNLFVNSNLELGNIPVESGKLNNVSLSNISSSESINTWQVQCYDYFLNYANSSINNFYTGINPDIFFVPPTDPNNFFINRNWTYVNVSVNDSNPTSSYIDFNRSLIGYWNFEDFNSTHVFDKSSYSISARNMNDAQMERENNIRGNYVNFNRSLNQGFIVENFQPMDDISEFTISFWVNFTPSGLMSSFVTTSLIKPGSSLFLGTNDLGLGDPITSFIVWGPSGTNQIYDYDMSAQRNKWSHFVAVYNSKSHMALYVNGIQVNRTNIASSNFTIGNDDFYIGNWDIGNTQYGGSVDEVMVFNRELSDDEILALYNSTQYQFGNNFTNLDDGIYDYYACAIDFVGNENCTETRLLTVDANPPVLEIIELSPFNNSYLNSSDTLY
jgi:formylglycine-generating enzyme required for sulfatase activity